LEKSTSLLESIYHQNSWILKYNKKLFCGETPKLEFTAFQIRLSIVAPRVLFYNFPYNNKHSVAYITLIELVKRSKYEKTVN
jgi:hypothetical protein